MQEGEMMKRVFIALLASMVRMASALDCQHPSSTPENIQCASLALADADAKLNEAYDRSLALFSGQDEDRWYPASTKEHLIAAEREWIKYRDENCAAISWNYKSGSIRTEMELSCRRELTEQRIKFLELFSGPG
jgi:uncharacterized protein YecT (DUF1311 family)